MNRSLAALASLSTVLAFNTASPRAHAFDNDEQYWGAVYFQAPVVEKLKVWIEPQYRYVPNELSHHRLLARAALYYPLGAGFTAWAGYAWTPVWNKEQSAPAPNAFSLPARRVDEHRPWQQLMHTYDNSHGVAFVNRFRFEERFIEGVESVSFRARYMARVQYRPKEWHGLGVVVWDELFLNLNAPEKGPKSGVDQNRFAVALQYALNKTFILEPTYMINGVSSRRKDFHTALLILWINL